MLLPRLTKSATILLVFLLAGLRIAGAQSPGENVLSVAHAARATVNRYTAERLRKEFQLRERTTATPWSAGTAMTFRGPLLKDILARNALTTPNGIEVRASNDFVSKISTDEIDRFAPILALEKQCNDDDRASGLCMPDQTYRPLSLEDGGPFYLIWPLNELPQSYVPGRNAIWVWFVVAICPVP